jgi:membrane protease YdiL (CAAX protease family)
LATQILLIALPEEYFYRGYLQTRLGEAFAARRDEQGLEGNGPELFGINIEVVVASFLFGIGHLLIPVGGVLLANRFAVFFPSLLFGALRRKTGSITAPVVYHALCNMMVLVAAVHFD